MKYDTLVTAYMSVQNAVTKLELSVCLQKIKSGFGAYVWEVKECYLV